MKLDLDKSTWKRVAFGDVILNVTDRVDDPAASGVERYLGLEHLDPGVLTVQRWDDPSTVGAQKLRFHPGDVIFGRRRAYQKKVAMAEFEGICSAHALVLRADPDYVHPDFLPHFLASDYFLDRAISISVGSLSPTVNWRDLKVQEFDLPPLDEQRRLADLLWAVERHRLNLSECGSHLSGARQACFVHDLARGVDENSWTERSVADLVTEGPRNGKSARANDEQRGVPTLSISAIRDGMVAGGDSVKHMDVAADTVSLFVLQDEDVLIVRGNGNKKLTGRAGLVRGGLPKGCVYPDLLVRLRFDPEVMVSAFATLQWNSPAAHGKLLQKAKSTSGIWKINGKDIKSHALVAPPVADQKVILNRIGEIEESEDAVEQELAALRAVAKSMSAAIFGGD